MERALSANWEEFSRRTYPYFLYLLPQLSKSYLYYLLSHSKSHEPYPISRLHLLVISLTSTSTFTICITLNCITTAAPLYLSLSLLDTPFSSPSFPPASPHFLYLTLLPLHFSSYTTVRQSAFFPLYFTLLQPSSLRFFPFHSPANSPFLPITTLPLSPLNALPLSTPPRDIVIDRCCKRVVGMDRLRFNWKFLLRIFNGI